MGRIVRRALVGAAVIALLTSGVVAADTLRGDSDTLTAGVQSSRDLGNVVAGSVVDVPVGFVLACANSAHVDVGQSVTISLSSTGVPTGGSAAFTPVTLGPVPAGWPADGSSCPSGLSLSAAGLVRLTTPSTPGGPHIFSLLFGRSLSPAGFGDSGALTGLTVADLVLTVVPNTPPELSLPADLTVEGNVANGATVGFSATATDADDDPEPTVSCTPASGDFFALGSTTVSCSATDSAGAIVSGSFGVAVVDTTPPVLLDVPADLAVTAGDGSGAVVTYPPPSATDVVDPAPVVACSPASGSLFPVGATTVICVATDASGNTSSASLTVTIDAPPQPPPPPPAPSPTLTVAFDPPIGPDGVLRVNGHRVVPVKARLASGGVAVRTGAVSLAVTACDATAGPDSTAMFPMAWQPGADRWMGLLSTALLPAGCFDVELVAAAAGSDGPSAAPAAAAADGGFTLWIDPPPSRGPKAR